MNKISKFLPYLILHLLIGSILCFAFSFYLPIKENLLPSFVLAWRLKKTALLFIFYFPVMFISSLIIGYSIIFGKHGPVRMPKHAPLMIKFIRSFFVLILITSILYLLMCEMIRPILIESQEEALQKTLTYNEYKKLSQEAWARKNYIKSLEHINRALSIWPESEEAIKLQENIKISCEKYSSEETKQYLMHNKKQGIEFKSLYTPEEALKTAERAMMVLDFYTAHYYAKMAVKFLDDDNRLKQEAEILADKAWKEIEKGKAKYLDKTGIEHFAKKQRAYEALQAGNFLEAYYSFLEINKELKEIDSSKKDPEIEEFLKLSEENLLQNVFFIDEIENIPTFELDKNIHFAIDKEKNLYINIFGLSRLNNNGQYEIYLKNAEIMKKIAGTKIWSVMIPYAKIKRLSKDKLLLQFKPVDRSLRNKVIMPQLVKGYSPLETKYNIELPLNFADFDLIEEASLGPNKMKLTSLYAFISKAKIYDFKKSSFLREFIFRVSEPLLFMIVSVLSVIIAWQLRLSPGKRFKKIWLITFPLFFLTAYILMETIQYLCKLQIAVFVSLSSMYASFIVFGILVALLIIVTIRLSYLAAE